MWSAMFVTCDEFVITRWICMSGYSLPLPHIHGGCHPVHSLYDWFCLQFRQLAAAEWGSGETWSVLHPLRHLPDSGETQNYDLQKPLQESVRYSFPPSPPPPPNKPKQTTTTTKTNNTHAHIHTHTHTYIHACTHTHIYTHTHAHTHKPPATTTTNKVNKNSQKVIQKNHPDPSWNYCRKKVCDCIFIFWLALWLKMCISSLPTHMLYCV